MGGGVTLRVLAVNDSIKVASLYGALTGDDEVHYCWLRGCRAPAAPTREPRYAAGLQEMDPDFLLTVPTPAASADVSTPYHEIFLKSSPSRHLANVSAAVIIHHGESDDAVPMQWSIDLANALGAEGKLVSLYTYPGEGHVFAGWGWQLFMTRTLSFFDEYLNPRETPITVERRVLRQERIAAELSY
jgi:dienelactone hydrolase